MHATVLYVYKDTFVGLLWIRQSKAASVSPYYINKNVVWKLFIILLYYHTYIAYT